MDLFEGCWTRFGKDNMSSEWNYTNENVQTATIEVISDADIYKMQSLNFINFIVITDVQFRLQQDNSYNPSSLDVIFLPDLTSGTMALMGDNRKDHTHLEWFQGI